MHFHALATDYDGTLAHLGTVKASTIAKLEKLRASGRKLLLVTGRQLDDLLQAFPRADIFDSIVAENGALLYSPHTRKERLLADPVPHGFVEELRRRNVSPIAVGRSIVATLRPHENAVLQALADLGLDRQIIFNKEAVMILPAGTNKASGLLAALREMKISPRNVVAVGDAENDVHMLEECGCGVAVANALDSVKANADLVTSAHDGAGVEELIAEILENDLAHHCRAQKLS